MAFCSAVKMKQRRFALACAAGAALLTAPVNAAYAQDHATADMDVTIQIKGGCTFNLANIGGGNIDLGSRRPSSEDTNYAGTFYLQCTNPRTAQLSLDGGSNGDGTAAGRKLKWVDNKTACTDRTCIPYYVYQGAAGTTIWGKDNDAYNVKATEYDSGDGTPVPFQIVVPKYPHSLESGEYTDKLTITIENQGNQ